MKYFGLLIEKAISKEEIFQYPTTILPLLLLSSDVSSKQQQNETSLSNQITKDFLLSKSDTVLGNTGWVYHGMIIFHMVAPQYRDWVKVVAKTYEKRQPELSN